MRAGIAIAAVLGLVGCTSNTGSTGASTTDASVTGTVAVVASTSTTTAPSTTSSHPRNATSTAAAVTVATNTSAATPASATGASDGSVLARVVGPSGVVYVQQAGDALVATAALGETSELPGAILAADGTTAAFPSTVHDIEQVVRFGDLVVVVSASRRGLPASFDAYSVSEHRWSVLPVSEPLGWPVRAIPADNTLLVVSWDEVTYVNGPGDVRIDLVHSDGSVTAAALPTDPWAIPVPGAMTVWTGRELVVYGAESQASDGGLRHPSAYNPATNTYRTLTDPPWTRCDNRCVWYSPHQGGDRQIAAWTGIGAFVLSGLGDAEIIALHDPERDQWERLPSLPISISQPWIEANETQVIVFSTNAGPLESPLGTAAVLDIGTRTWSTHEFATPNAATIDSRSLCPVRVSSSLVIESCRDSSDPIEPVALDVATHQWSVATTAQRTQALVGQGTLTLDELAAVRRS